PTTLPRHCRAGLAAGARQQDCRPASLWRDYRAAVGQHARRIDEVARVFQSGCRMSRVSWIRIAVVAIAIGLLEVCCRLGLIDTRVVIPPSQMAEALLQLLISGRVNPEIART